MDRGEGGMRGRRIQVGETDSQSHSVGGISWVSNCWFELQKELPILRYDVGTVLSHVHGDWGHYRRLQTVSNLSSRIGMSDINKVLTDHLLLHTCTWKMYDMKHGKSTKVHIINLLAVRKGSFREDGRMSSLHTMLYNKLLTYRTVGNLRGRKLSRISRKGEFRRENFCGRKTWHI